MRHLTIPYLAVNEENIELIQTEIDSLPSNQIDTVNWESYPSKPLVHFKIAHNHTHLFLKYFVEEDEILAATNSDNGEVWKDSCVEFFISFDEKTYYNLECNCIGAVLLRHQNYDKSNATFCPENILSQIKRFSTLGSQPIAKQKGDFKWSVLLTIPIHAFFMNTLSQFDSLAAAGNFYKCGDNLSTPHFLTWSEIDFPQPNFHLPQQFGKIEFSK